jgi:hypothetical protein
MQNNFVLADLQVLIDWWGIINMIMLYMGLISIYFLLNPCISSHFDLFPRLFTIPLLAYFVETFCHEFVHALTIWYLGGKITVISVGVGGGVSWSGVQASNLNTLLLLAVLGPLTTMILGLLLFFKRDPFSQAIAATWICLGTLDLFPGHNTTSYSDGFSFVLGLTASQNPLENQVYSLFLSSVCVLIIILAILRIYLREPTASLFNRIFNRLY